jgi:hypothetical protein
MTPTIISANIASRDFLEVDRLIRPRSKRGESPARIFPSTEYNASHTSDARHEEKSSSAIGVNYFEFDRGKLK